MKKILAIVSICTSILINGCAPSYVPNVINSPLLSNKKEIQASVSVGTSGWGIDPQIAYALTNHIGLMANGSFVNSESDSSNNYHKHDFVELGVGYYNKFNNDNRYEIFGGFGMGRTQGINWSVGNANADASISRVFLQPSIVLVNKRIFELSGSSRFVGLYLDQNLSDEIDSYSFLAEPVITVKLGGKHIKGIMQGGFSWRLWKSAPFEYRAIIFSVGIRAVFNKQVEETN